MTLEVGSSAKERAASALRDEFLRGAVRYTVDRLSSAKAQSAETLGDWETWREQGRAIRAHTIQNLDHYLTTFVEAATRNGTKVSFAKDAEEARAEVMRIVREQSAKRVVKSKSMLSEEIHLNECLEGSGVDVVETDLGEWIVQLAHEKPAHIILPAIHKPRATIQALALPRALRSAVVIGDQGAGGLRPRAATPGICARRHRYHRLQLRRS